MGALREVHNPATDEVIGSWATMSTEEVKECVARARKAQPAWEALGISGRTELLEKAVERIKENKDKLAQLVTKEVGRPLKVKGGASAEGEIDGVVYFANGSNKLEIELETVVEETQSKRAIEQLVPHGVVGVICPWNWPLLVSLNFGVFPALRMGNTVVLKPSEYATLCTSEAASLVAECLPDGVLEIATGAGEVGAAVVEQVDYIQFTGSITTGRRIAKIAAERLIPARCEMGGNDAAIVLPSSNVGKFASDIFKCASVNSGQTCTAIKRVYVHDDEYDTLVDALAKEAENATVGDGMKPGVVLGPMQNPMQLKIVEHMVSEARAGGARIVTGGQRREGKGLFYPMTIVADINDDARLVKEEQFGMALPVLRYNNLDDAITRANSVSVGLGASVWGDDTAEAAKVASKLQAGTVWCNSHGPLSPHIRFSGWKNSGFGDGVCGVQGLKSMARARVVSCALDNTGRSLGS